MSKISELSDGGSLLPTDDLIVVRSGGNVRVKADTVNVDQIRLGDNEQIQLGNSQDLTLVHTPTQSIINQAGTGDLLIQKAGSTKLTVNSSGIDVTATVSATNVSVPDDGVLSLGTSDELTLKHHNSGYSHLINTTGTLYIDSDSVTFRDDDGSPSNMVVSQTGIAITGTATGATSFETAAGGTFTTAAGNDLNIVYPDSRSLFIKEGSTTHVTVDNAGKVGIGVTPATPLNVAKTGDGTIVRLLSVGIGEWDFSMGNSSTLTGVGAGALELLPLNSGTGSEFAIGQAGSSTPVLHVKSGNVGIGGTPNTYDSRSNNLVVGDSGDAGITIFSGATSNARLQFAPSGDTGLNNGLIDYDNNNDSMAFATGGTERMLITTTSIQPKIPIEIVSSSYFIGNATNGYRFNNAADTSNLMILKDDGNLLLGKSALEYENTAGHIFRADGLQSSIRSGGNVADFNRLADDGEIIRLSKDGTTIGSIGVTGTNDLYITTNTANHTGLRLGEGYYIPTDNSGASADNAVDLGLASVRYKDLYLSGVARLGTSTTYGTVEGKTNSDLEIVANAGQVNGNPNIIFKSSNAGGTVTERMRIDSTGAVIVNNSGGDAQMYFGGTSGTTRMYLARSGSDSLLWNVSNGVMRFGTNDTEAARFDASQRLVLGGTSASAELYITKTSSGEIVRADNSQNNWSGVMYYSVIFGTGNNNGNTSLDRHFQGYAGGATRFVVCGNGDVKNNNNSYGAISDLKLKENIVDSGSQWDDIKALRIRKYSMKDEHSDAPTQIGVIAQELEAAGMGGLVTEDADLDVDNNDLGTTTKQVAYSVLYMKAVKALQEAMERIESLEARIAALES